ncbi:MAG: HipA domain-containing protein [Leucobacter sp.]
MRRLDIFLDGTLAGEVSQNESGAVAFEYDATYRSKANSTPLSLSMPTERQLHRGKAVNPYLAGLLPDSEGRLADLGRTYGVSSKNPVALLQHIGADAPGAVQVLPHGEGSPDAAVRRGDVTEHSDAEFAELIDDIVRNKETWSTSRVRQGKWSLPGAQPKVALFRLPNGKWGTPNDSTPTTHILKPSFAPYNDHYINEFMSASAARTLGLDAARDELLITELGVSVFVSERYDRQEVGGAWQRLHQEDLCQALSVMPEMKYQGEGGPGPKKIAQLFRGFQYESDRDSASHGFFDALVFNLAMQGTDAHAKNYSLMLRGDRISLAPLYDLGSHAPYPNALSGSRELAMSFEGEYRMSAVSMKDMVRTGVSLGIEPGYAEERAQFILSETPNAFLEAASEVRSVLDLKVSSGGNAFTNLMVDSIASYAKERGWIG